MNFKMILMNCDCKYDKTNIANTIKLNPDHEVVVSNDGVYHTCYELTLDDRGHCPLGKTKRIRRRRQFNYLRQSPCKYLCWTNLQYGDLVFDTELSLNLDMS